jgi:hypothetical protein
MYFIKEIPLKNIRKRTAYRFSARGAHICRSDYRELRLGKVIFADAAIRAAPIVRELIEGSSGSDSVVGIADCGIIGVTADVANVLVHSQILSLFILLTAFFQQQLS